MDSPTEKLYSKAKACKQLGISRARYDQFIESGILPPPFSIVPGSRPIHTESQIKIAELNLYNKAVNNLRPKTPGAKPIKPLSEKHKAQIRAYYENKRKTA